MRTLSTLARGLAILLLSSAPALAQECPAGQHWDASMSMCMPDVRGNTNLDFHLNQFLTCIAESGPRGRTKCSAPNMFMLDFEQVIEKCDSVKVQWMGTTDLWTIPKDGTPQLLQTGEANKQGVPFVDAQHPHTSPVMGLTFAEAHCFNGKNDQKLTLFFSPRGEATAGPQAFMHRASAEGNPNVPLSHHLQDVFHIMSSVLGAKFETGKWVIEGSVFSGREQSPTEVDLKMGKIDSVGVRVERQLTEQVRVGASYANQLDTQDKPKRETALSAWVMTDGRFKGGNLSTSTIWGQTTEDKSHLNSFLEELVYRFGKMQKDHVFSRLEVLQRTPEQLEIEVSGDSKRAEWVKAVTVGYERELGEKKGATLYAGGSYTKSYVPTEFKAAYGGNPNSGEVHLRVVFKKSKSWNIPGDEVPANKATYSWIKQNIIQKKCAMCHTTTQGDGDGLGSANFDTYAGLLKVVTPYDPYGSLFYKALKSGKMPRAMDGEPKPNPLADDELEPIFEWIRAGAEDN